MRKLKRLASLLLALVMCFGLTCTAFAADTGSITITNAAEGETYNVYKLLDLTYNEDKTSYSYILDSSSEWYDFFVNGAGKSYVSVDASTGHVTWIAGDTGTSSLASAMATAALAYAEENNISPTATDVADDSGSLTFSGLEYGYYLIDSSLGSLLTLDSTDPDAEVTDKNTAITPDKSVKEDSDGNYSDSNTADIGEVVNFRIEIKDAYGSSKVVLHDTLSEGLTLDETSFTVKVGTSLASADSTVDSSYYTITTTGLEDDCTFEIAFTEEYTTTVLQSSQVIVVEYTATVNADAVIYGDGNTNDTYVSYGNNAESTHDKTTTYVYELYVYKYTADSSTSADKTALAGAKFILYKTVNNVKNYAVLDADGKVSSWTQDVSEATELETGSDGIVYFGGLDAGSYYLEETEAPDGYNPLAAPVDIEIATDGTIKGAVETTNSSGGTTQSEIQIWNGSTKEMPDTGGIGTTIFYVVGGVLVVGAVVVLITRKRMNKD